MITLPVHRHDPSRTTVTTLASISLSEGLLQGVVAFGTVADMLYGGDLPTLA